MSASFPPEPPPRDPRPFRPGFTPFEEEPLVRSHADDALTPIRVTTYEVHPLRRPRMVMVYGELDGERATEVCSELMTLDALGDGPITMHLRARDMTLDAAFSLVDTIDVLRCPVHALVVGEVGGAALAVLASAQRREMTRHAVLRLDEPTQGFDGTAAELAMREKEHRRLIAALYQRLSEVTGRAVEEIRDDAERRRIFTATQALAYGFVHDVAGMAPPGLT
ncbi:ATP-dependent Clp protease proteolytic subunit [Actinomadura rudentiformis]|uniref:ATP-dependent Clp protease proteolytic subunit n=1 Tax=Actinomadura rudentiformis TaxID=359158 RepID=A0A6H9YUZ7_9ACTN|nr:ATP-dependent Clp protease proteolytic subunit [Actinomadura rudentiformis]KAB2344440.1 ATP-dependent Clp protease proteolytic subunit [Actinomadura rudentiformis]